MMRSLLIVYLAVSLALSGMGSVAAQTFPAVPPAAPATLQNLALRDWLRQNWYDGKHTVLSYSAARAKLYNYVDNQNNQVRCVYSAYTEAKPFSFTSTSTTMTNINCEHTVPQSWFNEVERMRSDIHHLFPSVIQWNSDRGSDPFAEIPDAQTTKWIRGLNSQPNAPATLLGEWSEDTSTQFEPRDDHKGNLARAVLYFYTMHANQAFDAGKNVVTAVGDLNTLYQWHQQDPVDAQEQERNRRAAASQGNYNPYINDPALVARAWGFQTSTPVVQFAAVSGTQAEGNSGTTTYTVNVTLTAEPSAAASVDVALDAAGTTAAAPADYAFTSPQTLSFGPGMPLSRAVSVTLNGDATVEADETVRLLLQNLIGPLALGSPATHTLTVANDDADSTPKLAFATASGAATEGNTGTTTYSVNVTLTPAATTSVTVPIEINAANTSADATDYALNTTSLTFAAGVTSRPVTVTVNGDAALEPSEVVSLRLGTPSGAVLGAATSHSLTLTNDDASGGTLACGGLFFSEYIESTGGNNKALEVYNPSDEPVNLAGYRVQLFANGSNTVTATLDLSGTLGGREVYVIINNQSTDGNFLAQGDAVSGVTNFNGNDALVLSHSGTTVDVIGVRGVDPGSNGWSVAGGSTANHTLVRSANVTRGRTTWSQGAPEWASVGPDSYTSLGAHSTVECPGNNPLPVVLTRFSAGRSGPATVLLGWQTAQEANSVRFEVEKSDDGRAFQPIGQVAAGGTTTAPRRYEWTDATAPAAAYYRLRQVDLDGTATLSPVAYVAAPAGRVSVFPNPTAAGVSLTGVPADASLTVALHAAHGRVLLPAFSANVAEAGRCLSTALRMSGPGLYLVLLEYNGQRHLLKLAKQ